MIEITVSHDKVFNSLSIFEQLLFLKVLPHTDDYGRFEGDAEILKARVDPLSKQKIIQYENAINNISKSGLWIRYKTPSGRIVIQYKPETFERINAFLVKKKGKPEYDEYKDGYELISSDINLISHNKYKVESNKYKVESKKQKDTIPPDKDDLNKYCIEIGLTIEDAEAFYDHFTSNGWRVGGKTPMRDWRASVRNWKRNKIKYGNLKGANNETTKRGFTKHDPSSVYARATFEHSEEDIERFRKIKEDLDRREPIK